ncbi:MAG: hypothetical protein ABSC36_04550 [Gaiellaceae bacterium]|jgi:heme O synthase-like polyprenyltransferase
MAGLPQKLYSSAVYLLFGLVVVVAGLLLLAFLWNLTVGDLVVLAILVFVISVGVVSIGLLLLALARAGTRAFRGVK